MKIGKLPNDVLNQLIIEPIKSGNNRNVEVKKGPSIGEDCALMDFGESYALVSTDPITATQANMGKLLATVCTNDVAACGGTPVALLVTALIPPTAAQEQIIEIMEELRIEAERFNIDIIGGHTEITDAVNRIVLSGTILGKVRKQDYYETGGAKVGDQLVMTKYAGLEGTSILAKEHEAILSHVLGTELITTAQQYDGMLSVLEDAKIAGQFRPSAMHDITEGGLLGAAAEAARAAGCGFFIDLGKVSLTEATKKICAYFDISPFELIGSGSLLIAVSSGEPLVQALKAQGINSAVIGEVIEGDSRIIDIDGSEKPLIAPDADAIYSVCPERTVLFVCTGNTCRSPMAEGLAREMAKKAGQGNYKFASRGLYANENGDVSPNALSAMEAKGIDIAGHKPKNLTEEEINQAEYLLVMTRGHKQIITAQCPQAAEKTFTLLEFANGGEGRLDILDPFGQRLQAYQECADEIEECMTGIIKRLMGEGH